MGWATQSGRTVAFARLMRNDASKPEGMSGGEWSREGLLREFPTLIPPLLK